MKQSPAILIIIFLFVSLQFHSGFAYVFSMINKQICIEVVDHRDLLKDIVFWIHHTKDTPVLVQKLINNGLYPVCVTIYNESSKSIKIMKNAIGGLSTAQAHEVAQLYEYNTCARLVKKVSLGAVVALVAVEALNSITCSALQNILAKIKYGVSCTSGFFAGIIHWSEIATINALISQTFKSHMLSEVSIVDPGCSISFLLFAQHTPSGHTLKVPILDEYDNQVVSFLCPFPAAVTS